MARGRRKRDWLTDKQIKCIKLMCETDMTRGEIATAVGCARSTIYEWLSDELFKGELIKYSDRLVTASRAESLRRIQALMRQDEDKRTALASAKFLAELNGLNPTTKIEQKNTEEIIITLQD